MTDPHLSMQSQITKLNREIGVLEGKTDSMEKRMLSLEERINQRLATQEKQIEVLSEKMGTLNSQAALLTKGQDENSKELNNIACKQDELLTVLSEAKGSWKLLGILGVVVTTCAAAVAWLIDTMKGIS